MQLTDTLLSGGMPTADQLAEASRTGVQIVINLAVPTSENALPDERGIVESLGTKYVGIPVEWDHPTRQNLNDFMSAMDASATNKTLVHCQASYRATGFITLYRVLRLGWKPEDALKDLRPIWNPDDYPISRKFMDENLADKAG